jgi:hypothetical protein
MDLYRIIGELIRERARLTRIIESLEHGATSLDRRARKPMDSAARQELSERMKRYWAKRREGGTGG